MDRIEVIQEIINHKNAGNYLEIGVQAGKCFLEIRARRKTAVDPQLIIPVKNKVKGFFTNYTNVFNRYFEETSDAFFRDRTDYLKNNPPEVVYIDGLHTYEQSLEDVYNSLKWLDNDGVIIVHDSNPVSEAAAYPAESIEDARNNNLPGWTGEWCGDVWKTILHLRTYHPKMKVFVLDCDYGLGIIHQGEHPLNINRRSPVSSIENMPYEELENNREQFLNLKEEGYLSEFLKVL